MGQQILPHGQYLLQYPLMGFCKMGDKKIKNLKEEIPDAPSGTPGFFCKVTSYFVNFAKM